MYDTNLQILLARQGIYLESGSVYAYELLYRNGNDQHSNLDAFDENAGIKATSSVIAQLFTNLDINTVVGGKLAFINFTYSNIINNIPRLLPKDRIVIEVLETVAADQQVLSHLRELKREGYQIALDDFIYKKELIPLIDLADVIKLDVLNQNKQQMSEQLETIKGFKGKLLAEKIEHKEQLSWCIDLGFDLFQGFFLNKPDTIKGHKITENTSQILRIISLLNNDDISVNQLEKLILQIPRLSYRILRVANSAYYYTGNEVTSLNDAVFRIGIRKVIDWANLILLASSSDTSLDLIERTLIRANMCELMAKAIRFSNSHEAYTVGMFSTLDGMLNDPLPLLLSKIKLDDSINKALLGYEGMLGKILQYVIHYEQAHFTELDNIIVGHNELTQFYLQSIQYAKSILELDVVK